MCCFLICIMVPISHSCSPVSSLKQFQIIHKCYVLSCETTKFLVPAVSLKAASPLGGRKSQKLMVFSQYVLHSDTEGKREKTSKSSADTFRVVDGLDINKLHQKEVLDLLSFICSLLDLEVRGCHHHLSCFVSPLLFKLSEPFRALPKRTTYYFFAETTCGGLTEEFAWKITGAFFFNSKWWSLLNGQSEVFCMWNNACVLG